MTYEVEVASTVYVSVEFGGEEAARRLVRDHVCNDWLLRSREITARDAGRAVVKGMSAAVAEVRPFVGNRRVQGKEDEK
jgi:hypothetical protein